MSYIGKHILFNISKTKSNLINQIRLVYHKTSPQAKTNGLLRFFFNENDIMIYPTLPFGKAIV
jgi:hypothetical protein